MIFYLASIVPLMIVVVVSELRPARANLLSEYIDGSCIFH